MNANDLKSLEQIYSFEDFQQDAARNAIASAAVLHGLRITSSPDAQGRFHLVAAKRQTGESEPEVESAFVTATLSGTAAETETAPGDHSHRRRDYEAFLARVVETARGLRLTPLSGDGRLQGFHGG